MVLKWFDEGGSGVSGGLIDDWVSGGEKDF